MRFLVLAILLMVMVPIFSCSAESKTPEQEATEAATIWLALVDSTGYGESWDTAAAYFKAAITKEQWDQSLKAVRSPLGEVKSREVTSATYATSLPGAPDGEYVVIQFSTSFENKKSTVETVTPMKEDDGSWRVCGYYIK